MLNLQNRLEVIISGNEWAANNNHNYKLAMVLEVSEAIEKTDWKWWKSAEFDVEGVRMELVDVLHFFLAFSIVNRKDFTIKELSIKIASVWNEASAEV